MKRNRHSHTATQVISLEPGVKAYEFDWCACGAIKLTASDPNVWREPDGLPWDVNGPATAVFCRLGAMPLSGSLLQDVVLHTGIHLENGECVDSIDAMQLLQSQQVDPRAASVTHIHVFLGDPAVCACGQLMIPMDPDTGFHVIEGDHEWEEVERDIHTPCPFPDRVCSCGMAIYFRPCRVCGHDDFMNDVQSAHHASQKHIGDGHEFDPIFTEYDGHRHVANTTEVLTVNPPRHRCTMCSLSKAITEVDWPVQS